MDYIEKWPFMVIFQYNLYIFGIHLWTVFLGSIIEPGYIQTKIV